MSDSSKIWLSFFIAWAASAYCLIRWAAPHWGEWGLVWAVILTNILALGAMYATGEILFRRFRRNLWAEGES